MPRPAIYLSAVGSELKGARQLVADTLRSVGREAIWQDSVDGGEPCDPREILRRRIDECEGLIQLVGQCYGPEPPAPDEEFGRVSYTQYEALYAGRCGKPVRYLFLDESFPRDPFEPEPEVLTRLQNAYAGQLRADQPGAPMLRDANALAAMVTAIGEDLVAPRGGLVNGQGTTVPGFVGGQGTFVPGVVPPPPPPGPTSPVPGMEPEPESYPAEEACPAAYAADPIAEPASPTAAEVHSEVEEAYPGAEPARPADTEEDLPNPPLIQELIHRHQPPRVQIEYPQTQSAPTPPAQAQQIFDEDVQFTVYRPETMVPSQWSTWLAFAHRGAGTPVEPDYAAEVENQARAVLGAKFEDYATARQESGAALPRESMISIIPTVDGLEFNPAQRSFVWQEPVHREEFRARALAAATPGIHRGRITFYLGALVIAEVNVKVTIATAAAVGPAPAAGRRVLADQASAYRQIFASYSRRDTAIVEHFEKLIASFGDRYLRDVHTLRAGEEWNPGLERMIRDADVFQLFWSSNSMRSRYVRQEWEYALSLGRPSFVRPTYWEKPIPKDPGANLPPDDLRKLHFQHLPIDLSAEAIPIEPPRPPAEPARPPKKPITGSSVPVPLPPPSHPDEAPHQPSPHDHPRHHAPPRGSRRSLGAVLGWLSMLLVVVVGAGGVWQHRMASTPKPDFPGTYPGQDPSFGSPKLSLVDRIKALWSSTGNLADAEQQLRTLLAKQEPVLGADAPEVSRIRYGLALTLEQEKKYPEALDLAKRAEADLLKSLGAENEDTKDATALRVRLEGEAR